MRLRISPQHLDIMRSHVEAQAPLEACGLLAGKEDVVERVFLIENALQSAVRFQMDPAEQLSAFDWMESNGQDLLGIFHSHPAGPEMISETDIAESMYLVVQVVWSRPGGTWQARGFWIEQGEAREVELQIAGAE